MRLKRATAEGGELSVQCVIKGINLAMNKHIDALVTAPICKEAILLGGYGYPGIQKCSIHFPVLSVSLCSWQVEN